MRKFKDYNLEELKATFDNAVAETTEYIKKNGLVDGFKEEYDKFVSALYVCYGDGEIFHYYGLSQTSDSDCDMEMLFGKGISIVTSAPEVQSTNDYKDVCNKEEMQKRYEDYVDQCLEFISFEEFTDFLESLT